MSILCAVVGIVPAGGSGERLGADRPKAFVVCAGRPLIDWSLEVLEAVCDRVVVAAPPAWLRDGWVEGGASRSASVRNALAAAPEARTAVVHDAARPLVTRELVEACVGALMGVDGAIAAAPVTDTVKEAYPDGTVLRTLDRARLWAVQTPQVFRARRRCAGRSTSTTRRSRPRPTTPRSWRPPAGRCGWSRRPPGTSR